MDAPHNQTTDLHILQLLPKILLRAALVGYVRHLRIQLSIHSRNTHLPAHFPFNSADMHQQFIRLGVPVDMSLRRVGGSTTLTSWSIQVDGFGEFARFEIPADIINDPVRLPFNVDAGLVLMALETSLVKGDTVEMMSYSVTLPTGDEYLRFRLATLRGRQILTGFRRSRLRARGSVQGLNLIFDDSLDVSSM